MVEQGPATPGRIFISYRREETAYPAGWLFDKLADHFGEAQIFKDIDSIEPGDDFVETITAAVGSCDVLLALIGDRWLTMNDTAGHRRLDDANDFVRLEIEAALSRNVRVIPILVEQARMPRADELPASLASLVRRQALELSPSRFETDLGRLVRVLEKTLAEAQGHDAALAAAAAGPEGPAPTPGQMARPDRSTSGDTRPNRVRRRLSTRARIAAAAAVLLMLLVVVVVLASRNGSSPSDNESPSTEEPAPSEEGAWPRQPSLYASGTFVVHTMSADRSAQERADFRFGRMRPGR